MKIHELKIKPWYFDKVLTMEKPFEVRKNDRNFKVGDQLLLKEFVDPKEIDGLDLDYYGFEDYEDDPKYTGRICHREITYVLNGKYELGFAPEYVCLGLKMI